MATSLAKILSSLSLSGIALIVALFVISVISTIFVTGTQKWAIISTAAIPAFMNSSLSPEFAQVVARFGECMAIGITPILAYFTIYIAYLEKYNQDDKPISLFKTLKYQRVYSLIIGIVLLLALIGWYLIGLPIGINGSITT